jgi:hypothetical protein
MLARDADHVGLFSEGNSSRPADRLAEISV